eukprot:scaffold20417_cov21-Tisochrysis_lutea.AAC.3
MRCVVPSLHTCPKKATSTGTDNTRQCKPSSAVSTKERLLAEAHLQFCSSRPQQGAATPQKQASSEARPTPPTQRHWHGSRGPPVSMLKAWIFMSARQKIIHPTPPTQRHWQGRFLGPTLRMSEAWIFMSAQQKYAHPTPPTQGHLRGWWGPPVRMLEA